MKRIIAIALSAVLLVALTGCGTGADREVTTALTTATQETTINIDKIKSSLSIYFIHASEPNSADGVNFEVSFKNLTDKTINYITFNVQAINAVGDPVEDEISGKSARSCKLTGPVKPNADGRGLFECVWYNGTISTLKLIDINIEYSDDTELYIPNDAVSQLSYVIK